MSLRRMAHRCPDARPVASVFLPGWRLQFERVATLAPDAAACVPAALYRVTEACQRALDVIEGVDEGRYRRHLLALGPDADGGADGTALTYLKVDDRRGPPAEAYLAHIVAGYHDWGHQARLGMLRAAADATGPAV